MTDESENISLEFIGEQLKRLLSDSAEMRERMARLEVKIENIDATMTRMHADVVDAKATGKEVAVRLSLIEIRLGKIENAIGLVKA